MSFECHVTVQAPAGMPTLEALALRNGWKTSVIDGDPLLGAGPRFYFTRHSSNYESIRSEMLALWDDLAMTGVRRLRRKIEAIIYDERFQ